MKLCHHWLVLTVMVGLLPATCAAAPVDTLLGEYRQQGAGHFDAAAGRKLWNLEVRSAASPQTRSCASCHGANPRGTGRHVRTGKAIEPLAPSLNSKRLTDIGEIRKWLKRNCKWTLGRECTAQEKGDVLTFLRKL